MAVGMLLPKLMYAQGVAGELHGLQGVLDRLYAEMLPMCSSLIGVGQAIAGFAALWYIASRVWKHLANAEPIDFYPLFRPFCVGFCIASWPLLIALINGVLQPTVTGTAAMVDGSKKSIALLLKQKEEKLKGTNDWKMYVGENKEGDRDLWYRYTHDNEDPSKEGMFAGIGNDIRFMASKQAYNFKNSIKQWMSEVLNVLYEAAALCINTLRTFQLLLLAIIGPFAFGIAVFDGFQHTLVAWLAKYINIFLWLPVANIFGAIIGKIQEQMIRLDMNQAAGTFFDSNDIGYLIFLIIGIIGYFTVPSVANSIINAGGAGNFATRVTSMAGASGNMAASGGMAIGQGAANVAMIPHYLHQGYTAKDKASDSDHMGSKISGDA